MNSSVTEMGYKTTQSEQNVPLNNTRSPVLLNNHVGSLVPLNNHVGSVIPLNDQASSSGVPLSNQAGSSVVPLNNQVGSYVVPVGSYVVPLNNHQAGSSALPLNNEASSSTPLKDQAGPSAPFSDQPGPSSVPFDNHAGSVLTVEGNAGQRGRQKPALKKGPWTSAEDAILVDYVRNNGQGKWNSVQKNSGLMRCGKSCRMRWINHLKPNLKKGSFSAYEERLLVELHATVGNKWARMSVYLPGRTDNEIKNYWNTRAKRRRRAHLPIYPPEVLQALKENWQPQNANEFNCPLSIDDFPIDTTPVNNQGIVFSETAIPNKSFSSMLNQVPSWSQNYNFLTTPNMVVPPRESDIFAPHFSFGGNINHHSSLTTPYNPLQQGESPAQSSANPGANVFVNNFPASKPLGLWRGELPSLQCPDPGYWSSSSSQPHPLQPVTTFAPPPLPSWPLQSDSSSQMNSELLDVLLHQSQNLSTRNVSFNNNPNSRVVAPGDKGKSPMPSFDDMQWNGYAGFAPSFGHPAMPVFNHQVHATSIGPWNSQVAPTIFVPSAPVNNESVPASVGLWRSQVAPSTFVPGSHVPQGGDAYVAPNGRQEVPMQQNVWNADSFMNMGWDEIVERINDPSFLGDDLPRLFGEDSLNGFDGHQQTVAGPSISNQEWVGASRSNQGFVRASTSNQGRGEASTSNQAGVNNHEWGSSSSMWNNNGCPSPDFPWDN